ncbi:MAG: ATP-binding protein [Verrucomicrobiota bacterium]
MIDEMSEGALLLGPDGTILYANTRFARLAGRPLEQVIGSSWVRFFAAADHPRLETLLPAAKAGGVRGEFVLQAEPGAAARPVAVFLCAMKRERVEGFSVVVTDLTERRAAQAALGEAKEKLEIRVQERTAQLSGANTRLRRQSQFMERRLAERGAALRETTDQLDTFVHTLAHDMQATLRAQVAFAALLLQEYGAALGETGSHYARRIAESAGRQALLLSDLLRYMSLSRLDLPTEPVDLHQAVKQAQADLVLDIERRQASVTVEPVQGQAVANPALLHLILTNLMSNALKFMAPGTRSQVRIWTELRPASVPAAFCLGRALARKRGKGPPEHAQAAARAPPSALESLNSQSATNCLFIRLWVADNGLGIPAEHLNKLFGACQQLHAARRHPGTGIGLALVKKAAERMGGRVGVESEVGKGSRFWVELRAA